ncbi:ABC transporter permease [Pseudonocardia sulfidoxydans NBRC 16205]|uniref:ABC transporter permease n=1 Tax=Pseudonocardia sulfidoxydans NBRC 16205 TaxID=1223511 RepID=A0A511DFH7_9PSEU|nr:ABC transporter permease subunit [Pseudonocardia sulfidoxydans]GEL23163.1 ABC transporter permease [Pseudonocardia sulfidoxydans NBRC 16205]
MRSVDTPHRSAATGPPARPDRRRFAGLRPGPWVSGAVLLVLLAVWQLGAWTGLIDPRLLSSPVRVVAAAWEMLGSGALLRDTVSTFATLLVAVVFAIVVGELIGLALGRSERLRWTFEWQLVVLNSMPRIAFIPIVILAVGVGGVAKSVIGFLSAVVPIALFVMTGVRQVSPTMIQVAQSLAFGRSALWTKILVPASLPHLALGLRLGFSRALLGVVVTEVFNPVAGLGRWIALGRTSIDPSRLIVAALVIGAVGTVVVQGISAAHRRLGGAS